MHLLKITSFAALLFSATASQAAIVFTIEAPGVTTSQVAGVTTETFDSGSYVGSPVGTYTGGSVQAASVYGGAGGSNFLFATNPSTTLTFGSAQAYFGMWWSAGDAGNQLSFYDGATLVGSFNIGSIIPFLSPAYYGNPGGPFAGGNTGEPYVYLNFTATGSTDITSVVFSGSNFETDNHSITDVRITPPGTDPTNTPDGGSTLALGGMALLGLAGLRRALGSKKA